MKDLFQSKKFLAALLDTVLMLVGAIFEVDYEYLIGMCSPLALYILGQAWADRGKEAALVQAYSKEQLMPPIKSITKTWKDDEEWNRLNRLNRLKGGRIPKEKEDE